MIEFSAWRWGRSAGSPALIKQTHVLRVQLCAVKKRNEGKNGVKQVNSPRGQHRAPPAPHLRPSVFQGFSSAASVAQQAGRRCANGKGKAALIVWPWL